MKTQLSIALALVLAACGGGGGGGSTSTQSPGTPSPPSPPAPPTPTYIDSLTYSSSGTASLTTPNEITAITKHQLAIGGTTLNYTATVGHLTAMTLTNPAPEASFFYIAYTLDGANAATRPVTFFYNGGPGSATVWLHLGSFGPKRLVTNAPSTTTPTPFAFVDNTESLLDASDLVFVDAIGTGFSEAIAPNNNRTFWGTDPDAAAFRDFVIRYASVNGRTASPKFLFGESYGTPRSAILVNLLESAGTVMTGVVLQSSILNYNTNCGVFETPSISCAPFLPSYAAVGAWLTLVTPPQPIAQIPAYMTQMRTVASTQYDPAIRNLLGGGGGPSGALATTLAADTGMPAGNWSAHFNMDPGYFHDNLVPNSVLGFYDGRMVAQRGTPLAADDDPSSTMYNASFASTIVSYLNNDLNYTNPSAYTITSNAINVWNFSHAGQSLPDTVPDLAAAMAQNAKLKVFSANGYHDMVTPFYNTELDISRLGGNPNIAIYHYQGGHMTYLDDVARVQEKADLAAFYASLKSKAQAIVPAAPMAVASETPRSTAAMPAAVYEMQLRDPMLPQALRSVVPVPPTKDDALKAEVEQRLRTLFDGARAKRTGMLTLEEARAAGLGFIANNFTAIDARGAGSVTFEDVKRFMREQGATMLPQ
jgi:carboxypeptidase C (cathepsin A)